MKRRDFLKQSTFASGMFFVPQFLKAFERPNVKTFSHKKLIIIQLKGGNDGLNTVVPYTNDIYFKNRKNIALQKSELLAVNDEVGLHPSFTAFKDLFDKGYVSIINNVGYPNPNLSHFRSTDIWQTASNSDEYFQNGWVGRFLDYTKSKAYGAIEVDDTLSLMLKGVHQNGLAVTNPQQFYKALNEPFFNKLTNVSVDSHLNEHNLGYLYSTMIDAKSSANYIFEKNKTQKSSATYPDNAFGKQLKTIAEFIHSGLETQVYYAGLGGFDTHANQPKTQENLLKIYSESVAEFVKDLEKTNQFDDVLIITFSEFGRRLKQNTSNGTDHGAANNVFIVGKNLQKQGFYNSLNTLENLDEVGNIQYEIDFREIYATLLDKWLQVDDSQILNKSFSKLNFI